MKKKAIPPFSLTAGQTGRLLFNFTLPEGTAKPALRGALMVHGQKVDMQAGDDDTLTIPPLPAGIYLTEVRAAGICILYGHVEVLPSPLFEDTGVAAYKVDVDSSTDLLRVNLSMVEGIPGMQGAQGEQGEKGDTGASAYQLAAQYGYAGTEAEWIAELQGAQAAATAAKESALQAASSATNADASAELASEHAAEAAGCATDAQQAQQAAANSAATAASTLANTAKKTENNTFTGTNTFNGVIAANGGITGLPGPAAATAALHQQGGALLAFTQRANTLQCSLSWSKTSTTGTVVAGGSVESAAIDVFAAGKANVSYYRWGNYISYTALYMPFTIETISDGGALHIALPFGTGNYGARTMTVIGQPVVKYESIPANNSLSNRHVHGVELIISRSGSTYSAIVRGWKTEGTSLTGMREARFNLITTMVPTGNSRGITGVLMVRTSDTTAAIFLRSTYMSSVKWHAVGEVNVYSSLYANNMAPMQVGVQGAKVTHMDSVYILAGAPCADAAKVLRAETVTTTVTDKTFDDYKTEYPA